MHSATTKMKQIRKLAEHNVEGYRTANNLHFSWTAKNKAMGDREVFSPSLIVLFTKGTCVDIWNTLPRY